MNIQPVEGHGEVAAVTRHALATPTRQRVGCAPRWFVGVLRLPAELTQGTKEDSHGSYR